MYQGLSVAVLLVLLFACNSTPVVSPASTPIPTLFVPGSHPTDILASPTHHPTDRPTIPPGALPTVSPVPRATLPPSPTSVKPAIDTPAWFNDVVLYEIFPRSFYDTGGDGIGDLKGITAKLDYLDGLGVGALWLTPVFASPSYHGYDASDYYKINPDFGTEQDLVELVQAAHQRNIKVILDFVAGHTSKEHPFFKDAFGNPKSKYSAWYRWLNDDHTKYEYFGTSPGLPSLNQDNPETRAYLIEVAKYWMQKADLDGYRLDYALGVSHDFWKEFRAELKALDPDFLLLGEVWTGGLKIAPYYDDEFDATFDFPVYFDLMGSHERAGTSALLGSGRSPATFESLLRAQVRLYNPGAQSVRFLNNHDTLRVASQLQDTDREKLAATLLLSLPATPMIYYGEEIGMRGDKSDGDKTLREPMDWYAAETGAGMTSWYKPQVRFNKAKDGISIEEQQNEPGSLLEHYRALIALRKKYPVLRTGEFVPLPLNGGSRAVAFLRRAGSETLVVLLNFDTQPVSLSLDPNVLPAKLTGFTDLLTGETLPPPVAPDFSVVVPPLQGRLLRVLN